MDKIIPFNKGIHRQPSLGEAGELSECVNLIPVNGELVNVRGLEDVGPNIGGTLLAIHKMDSRTNYIYVSEIGGVAYLYSVKQNNNYWESSVIKADIGNPKSLNITPIGNILSISTDDGMKYVLWNGVSYVWLGSLPKIEAIPYLSSDRYSTNDLIVKFNTDASFDIYLTGTDGILDKEECIKLINMDINYIDINDEQRTKIYNKVFPTITKFDRLLTKDGYFTSPFYVVLAYRMYDGSYISKTAPILLTPTTLAKPIVDLAIKDDGTTSFDVTFLASKLYVDIEISDELALWRDLISSVSIFVSPQYKDYIDSPESIQSVGIAQYVSVNGSNLGIRVDDMPKTMLYDGKRRWDSVDFAKDEGVGYVLTPTTWPANKTIYIAREKEYEKRYIAFKDDAKDLMFYNSNGIEHERLELTYSDLGLPMGTYAIYDITNLTDRYGFLNRAAEGYFCQGPVTKTQYNIGFHNINYGRPDGVTIDQYCTENATFYKIADIELSSYKQLEIELKNGELTNLTSNENMDYSEFLNSDFISRFSMEYNRRANHASVSMKYLPFDSLTAQNIPARIGYSQTLGAYVQIVDNGQHAYVEIESNDMDYLDINHFAFPSSKAKNLIVLLKKDNGGNDVYYKASVELNRHKYIDLSYVFNGYKNLSWNIESISKITYESERNSYDEKKWINKHNTIISSKTDNPFVFPKLSNLALNNSIINISTASKAISQGQFGQFPLYVFCSDGIWALEIASDGTFSTKQPVSRDVCNNPDSITQIDNAVVFTTDQGLKLIQGSDVVLLSGRLEGNNIDESDYFNDIDGKKFFEHFGMGEFDKLVNPETRDIREIFKTCRIAYDYANQLLRIFPKREEDADTTIPYKYYVYSFTTQEFATVIGKEFDVKGEDGTTYDEIKAVVADYPSSVIQIGNKLYRPMETEREGVQNGLLLTRPLLFDEPFALKKLQDMRLHYSNFSGDSKCKVVLYVSNDGVHWKIARSLRGGAYKYFRIAVITKMTDADALTGAIVRYELERTNKLR